MKHLLKLNLQFFAKEVEENVGETSEDTGVEEVPAAEEQEETQEERQQEEKEPEKNFEKAFAKRLKEAQSKWESEKQSEIEKIQEQYKDFDTYKKATEFLMKSNGIDDPMSLREQIELVELQERADHENVPPEVLKRIDELEAKAAKAEEYEKLQEEQTKMVEFESTLKEFVKDKDIDGKPVDHKELWEFMYENGVSKPEVALKAMKAEVLEKKLSTVKEDAVKEYLESKRAPKAEGSGSTAFEQKDTSKMTWEEIDKVAASRLRAANQPQ